MTICNSAAALRVRWIGPTRSLNRLTAVSMVQRSPDRAAMGAAYKAILLPKPSNIRPPIQIVCALAWKLSASVCRIPTPLSMNSEADIGFLHREGAMLRAYTEG